MGSSKVTNIERVIEFIEDHLNGKLDLDMVAEGVHYSKYYLHRMFTDLLGMTLHEYAGRRQMTEAAKLLIFSKKSIMEIALICGYESRQAFTEAFKGMYKTTPAKYRKQGDFYPLQLRFVLHQNDLEKKYSRNDIRLAEMKDVSSWMELVRLVVDGYPCLDEVQYEETLKECIDRNHGLILKEEETAIGVMIFSDTGNIEFMGVHPQYRNRGLHKLFLEKLIQDFLPDQEISITTYREHDKADTGYRKELKQLGFAEKELLTEFGYPTQRFVFLPKQ